MTPYYDPPSDPEYRPPRKGAAGGRIIHETCPECDGNGWNWYQENPEDEWVKMPCSECQGTGEIETEDCPEFDE